MEDTQDQYLVHKELIEGQSEFVKQCISSGFKEEKEQKVTIREWTDKQSMDLVMEWLYTGFQAIGERFPTLATPSTSFTTELVNVYLLADRLMMSALKNDIVNRYRKSIDHITPDIELLQTLDAQCPDPCQFKALMLDDIAHRTSRMPTRKTIPLHEPK